MARYFSRKDSSRSKPDRVDHLVDEAIRRDVGEIQALVPLEDVVADRMHQVGLAQTDAAVDEERVVGLRGDLRDGASGGMRELVRRADDEALEGVSADSWTLAGRAACPLPAADRTRTRSAPRCAAGRAPVAPRRSRRGSSCPATRETAGWEPARRGASRRVNGSESGGTRWQNCGG